MVFQLPEEPVQGDLTVLGRSSNLLNTVEQGYKTVDQKGTQWPAIRTTFINSVYATTGSGISSTMKDGIGDAMRNIQFTYLLEYVPGNVINSTSFKDSIPELLNRAGERISANSAYGFLDASGNSGFFGNAIVLVFTKYINQTFPSPTPLVREILFDVNTETYQNTASASGNTFKKTTTLSLKYNALKKYTIEQTTQLNRIFDFQNIHAWGTVSGTSTNLDGSNPVEVGQIVVDNDIAFRIATGPFGTEGTWFSSSFRMPQGWLVDRMIWSEKRDYSESAPNIMAFSGQESRTGATSYMRIVSGLAEALSMNCPGNGHHYMPISDETGFASCAGRWLRPSETRIYHGVGSFLSSQLGPDRCSSPCREASDCYPVSIGLSVDDRRFGGHLAGCNFVAETDLIGAISGQIVRGTVIVLKSTTHSNNSVRVLQKLDRVEFLGPHGASISDLLLYIYLYNSSTFRPQSGDNPSEEEFEGYDALVRYKISAVNYYMNPLR